MDLLKRTFIFFAAVYLLASFKSRETTWVAIGDSITYLNDHRDETANRVTKGYLTAVTEHFPGLHYINKGFNGWTSGNIADRIDSLGLSKADTYSVFLGTNDWWQGRPVGTFADYKGNKGNGTVYGSFRIIINKLRNLNPQANILLITPMQRGDFVYINDHKNNAYGSYKLKNGQSLEAFAVAIDSIGRYENIPVVDLYHNKQLPLNKMVNFKRLKNPQTSAYTNYKYPKWIDVPFNPATDEYPYPQDAINTTFDGLHPSDKGYAIITKEVIARFESFNKAYIEPLALAADSSAGRWAKYISLKTYTKPFWQADTITDETVQVIRDSSVATAPLLFKAKKILSVKAANYSREFIKGKDWDYKNGQLVFGPQSAVPFFHQNDLVLGKKIPGRSMDGKVPGTYVLFSEGYFFSSKQIAVTYIRDKGEAWKGPVPQFAAATLPNSIGRLQRKQHLNIVFFGNSIEVGYNASGLVNAPPYMPVWPELIVNKLKAAYGGNITFANTSVAGRAARWGMDSVQARVTAHKPDLVIIGFGMNDGTGRVPPDVYREQIKRIVDAVSANNPAAEFILIAPMLANPASVFDGLQASYKQELDKLTRTDVVVADMTGVHRELLKHKSYQDMTGNNINHPNDYLARWYAQIIAALLIK